MPTQADRRVDKSRHTSPNKEGAQHEAGESDSPVPPADFIQFSLQRLGDHRETAPPFASWLLLRFFAIGPVAPCRRRSRTFPPALCGLDAQLPLKLCRR